MIEEIEKFSKIYQTQQDNGRQIAYRKAITIIKGLGRKIETLEDLEGLPFVGEKLKKKILEIVGTGKCEKLATLEKDEENVTLELFSKI